MNDLLEKLGQSWDGFRARQKPLATVVPIPAQHCTPEGATGYVIRRNAMYFSVNINEMKLSRNTQWFTVYDPLVVIVVEFNHGGQRVAIPTVVGPHMLVKHIASGEPLFGTVLTDVRATGPHPYRGGGIDITVQFYRLQRDNQANAMLQIVESLSRAAGFGQIAAIAQTGASLLKGLESLAGLGTTVYLAGQRMSLAHSALDPLKAQSFAMLITPGETPLERLQVERGRLHLGTAGAVGKAYEDSDYVLFTVEGAQRREDENLLPFHELKQDAMLALADGEGGVKRAKALLLTAYQQMRKSEDLTEAEADLFFDEWVVEFNRECTRLETMNSLSHALKYAPSEHGADAVLDSALERLAL